MFPHLSIESLPVAWEFVCYVFTVLGSLLGMFVTLRS